MDSQIDHNPTRSHNQIRNPILNQTDRTSLAETHNQLQINRVALQIRNQQEKQDQMMSTIMYRVMKGKLNFSLCAWTLSDGQFEFQEICLNLSNLCSSCICVPYYQCQDGNIITDGTGQAAFCCSN